ncbi:unnamed protein product [Cyprideis torosa]|uniref:palmitoyl-protein hydrolase n=1 Tax=Cyprideis torosa TaxID=163714 RepID=A0A7R8ZIK5_9CRUS|nr:unnamed protein product [Cyprideis torosa]CAG0886343.1 unnamed protein product [Cyprideis torosa]
MHRGWRIPRKVSDAISSAVLYFKRISSSRRPVVAAASGEHSATFFFFHGLGDTGHGWCSSLASYKPPHVKVVCPTAKVIRVTLNMGMPMPAWFDLKSLKPGGAEDQQSLHAASLEVHKMIEDEVKAGIPYDRIVIGGFSMGGALALYSALTFPHKLAGIVVLSGWMPVHQEFQKNPSLMVGNKDTNLFQAHGDSDHVVPYVWGKMTAEHLSKINPNATFKTYSGLEHSSSDAELRDVKTFLQTVVPAK